jgi:hypothetical protein
VTEVRTRRSVFEEAPLTTAFLADLALATWVLADEAEAMKIFPWDNTHAQEVNQSIGSTPARLAFEKNGEDGK